MSNFSKSTQCSFCAKCADDVKKLIAGPGVFICDECIGLCKDILTLEFADLSKG